MSTPVAPLPVVRLLPSLSGQGSVQALLEALPIAAAVFDQELRLVRANARFSQLTGCRRDRDRLELHAVFPTALSSVAPALAAALRGTPLAPRTVAFPYRGGALLAEVEVVSAPGCAPDGGDAVLFTASSIRSANAEEVAAVRNAPESGGAGATERVAIELALARFSSAVSHDVANLLNPIGAAAHLLAVRAADPATVRDNALRISRAVELGAELVARLARVGRMADAPSGQLGPVNFSQLTARLGAEAPRIWHLKGERGRLHVATSLADAVHVLGDSAELTEALGQLIRNALEAMSGGDGVLDVSLTLSGPHAVLAIADEGRGIDPEICRRAGEPFAGGRRTGAGRGLGLAEVTAVARRHGGHLVLERRIGPGTIARLYLPRLPIALPAQSSLADAPRAVRCLVVEDDRDARELMRALLATAGHHVLLAAGATDAARALERAAANGTPVDVLLTDLALADGCGRALAAEARERWPRMRIGVVTGAHDEELPAGADFLLRKPFRTGELLAHVAVSGDAQGDTDPGTGW